MRLMSHRQRRITMPKRILILGVTALFAASVVAEWSTGTAAAPVDQKKLSFLDRLKVGRPVSLTEAGGHYELTLLPEKLQPLGHKIIEIGGDYVLLRDLGEITDSAIPIYSISAIKTIRVPGK
jgi:hypothetical protein